MTNIHSYQSANLTDDEIIDNFIVRKNEFHKIISEIKRDDMTASIQHYILIGRRGSGKSTLLRRIQAEVNMNDELNKKLIVVNLSEEQAGVYRLYDLWDLIIRELNARGIQVDKPKWTDFKDDLTSYSQSLYKVIQDILEQQNKKLLLLLDNIDRIFDNITDDAHYLRELLINHKDMRIIGGSTRMSEHYWKYDKPFYEFFRTVRLNSLNKEEVKKLLLHWSDCLNMPEIEKFVKKNPGKIETIRVLTDGMPRTLLNFLEILIDRQNQNGFEFLRKIIDRASPIYQERLNRMPAAQRKIIIELSNYWDAVKVKQLIDKCMMPGKTISAQLNQLMKGEIVEKITTGRKDNLYRLSERFYNLWLLMTQGGPEEKRQVKYLTVFLESWYSKNELVNIYNMHIDGLNVNKLKPDYAAMMSTALAHSKYISIEQRDSIIEKTHSLKETIKDYLEYLPRISEEIFKLAMDKLDNGDYSGARNEIDLIEQEGTAKHIIIGYIYYMEKDFPNAEKYLFKAFEKGDIDALYNLANLYYETGRKVDAEKYYLLAIEKGVINALGNLANLYDDTNRKKEAEKYYLLAIEKGDIDALVNLANLYVDTDRKKEAEKYYLLAIEKGDIDALYNLAILYFKSGRKEEAETYYLLATEKGVVYALVNLANLYVDTGRIEEAEKYYFLAIEKGDIDALVNLANLYVDIDRKKEAEKYYLLAIEKRDNNALFNLANLYRETGRNEEAEKYYLLAIEKGHVDAMNNLASHYYETERKEDAEKYYLLAIEKGHVDAMNNLASHYHETGREEAAEKYYLMAIDKGIIGALFNLANLYIETGHNEEAEKYYLLAIEKGVIEALFNIANLYGDTGRNKEAEKYYLLAIKKGKLNALNSLALLYYLTNQNKNESIKLIEQYLAENTDLFGSLSYVRILLWTGQMEVFNKEIRKLIPLLIKNDEINKLGILFIEFLIHKQYNLAWQWFKDDKIGNQLKEMIKPIYYVTAELLSGKEQAEELLKPGPELEDGIKEIHEYIKEKQKFYYNL